MAHKTMAKDSAGKQDPIEIPFQDDRREVGHLQTLVDQYQKSEKELQYRISLERTVNVISSRFINLAPDKIDEGINETLKMIGEATDVDRSYVFLYSTPRKTMSNTHEWCKEGIASQKDRVQNIPISQFAWFEQTITGRGVVHVPCVEDLPLEASADKQEFKAQNIQSLICVPMILDGQIIGFMGFDSVRKAKAWAEDMIIFLKFVGEIITNALIRKAHEERLVKLNNCLLEFGINPADNINKLVQLCGELLKASCSFYSRIDNKIICVIGHWQAPEGMGLTDSAEGHICDDVVRKAAGTLTVISNLTKTRYALTDPLIKKFGFETYMGQSIRFGSRFMGSLCVLFQDHFIPKEADKKFFGIIAAAIGIEEERRREQENLAQSEARYKSLLASATDYIYTVTIENGKPTQTVHGPGCVAVTGYTSKDYIFKPDLWYQMVYEEDRPKVIRQAEASLKGENTPFVEHRIIHKNGTVRWVKNAVVVHKDANNQVVSYDGLITDITERKSAELALLDSEDRYRGLVETALDTIFTISAKDMTVVSLNPAFEQITGWSRAQWIGKPFVDIVYPGDLPLALNEFHKTLNQEQRSPIELRFRSASGKFLIGEVVSVPQIRDGKVIGIFGIARDITARRRAEEELHILSRAVEQSPNNIMITDTSGRILFVNAKFSETTGYLPQEVIGKNPSILKSGLTSPEEYKNLWETVLQGKEWRGEFRNKKKNGELYWGSAAILPIKNRQGMITHFLAVEEDITERKEFEQILKESEEKYRHLVELSPDAVFVRLGEKFAFINHVGVKMFGAKSPDEIVGKSVFDLVHPDYHHMVRQRFQQLQYNLSVPVVEMKMLNINGEVIDVEVAATPFVYQGETGSQVIARDIRQRKKTEAVLRQQSIAMMSSIDGMAIHNSKGEFVYLNEAHIKVYGYDRPEELIGKTWEVLYGGEELKRISEEIMPVFWKNGRWRGEAVGKRKDGTFFPQEISLAAIEGGGLVCVVRDITERKKVEDDLRISESRYRGILESQDDLIVRVDGEGRFTFVNDAYCKKFGKTRAELLGKTFMPLVHDEDLPATLEEMKKLDVPPYRATMQQRALTAEGWRWLSWEDYAVKDANGKTIEIQGVGRDITERKLAEEALKSNEELLRTVFDAMPHWVFVKDTDSRILMVNRQMAADYGLTQEEMKNSFTTDKKHIGTSEEKDFFVGVDQQVIETGEGVHIPEEKMTLPNGEVHYLRTIKLPLKNADGKVVGLVGVAEDITERKKVEAELDNYRKHLEDLVEERTRELRHSERLAATGRLAASIAHEINNPLQGITTHLEIIRDNLPKNFHKIKNYEFVKGNIEKIRGIVARLLDTYRGADENKTEIDINDVIEKVVSLVEHQLTLRKIRLNVHLAKSLPKVEGWRQQLYQVFLNIILNAQDSIKETGDVTIATSSHDGMVSVQVTDTGEGINAEDMDHLFEPFFTTKAESGTGLGLFVSHGIIKEHSGTIKVKSKVGEGSTFTVNLPVVR